MAARGPASRVTFFAVEGAPLPEGVELYQALIDMRVAAYEQRPQPIFYMADLMHTLPLQLERAAQGTCTYEEVLSQLRERAQDKGQAYVQWLDHLFENLHT